MFTEAQTCDDALEEFQSALLSLLSRPIPVEEMMHSLQTDPAFATYRTYVETFEPHMVEVAAALVKKWGRDTSAT